MVSVWQLRMPKKANRHNYYGDDSNGYVRLVFNF